jgi:hypothetical protein
VTFIEQQQQTNNGSALSRHSSRQSLGIIENAHVLLQQLDNHTQNDVHQYNGDKASVHKSSAASSQYITVDVITETL